jgi:hypothetical protein
MDKFRPRPPYSRGNKRWCSGNRRLDQTQRRCSDFGEEKISCPSCSQNLDLTRSKLLILLLHWVYGSCRSLSSFTNHFPASLSLDIFIQPLTTTFFRPFSTSYFYVFLPGPNSVHSMYQQPCPYSFFLYWFVPEDLLCLSFLRFPEHFVCFRWWRL